MTINQRRDGSTLVLTLVGRMDTSTSPEAEAVIIRETKDVKELILDLMYLDYVSSAGLRVILKAQKIMNSQGRMKLIHVKKDVLEILDITGFINILTIE